MKILKINQTVFDVGFDSDWNKLMRSYEAKGFDQLIFLGDLDLYNTKITSLPDNLSVGGNLDLRYTKITSLPDNLSVGGDMYLSNTKITSLPDNLSVKGEIYKDF